jgi:hypothetical protein
MFTRSSNVAASGDNERASVATKPWTKVAGGRCKQGLHLSPAQGRAEDPQYPTPPATIAAFLNQIPELS